MLPAAIVGAPFSEMSFDSVTNLSDSGSEHDTGLGSSRDRPCKRPRVADQFGMQIAQIAPSTSFESIDALTESDVEDKPRPRDEPRLVPKSDAKDSHVSRRSKKRKREESAQIVKKRIADRTSVKSLLLKACHKKCKRNCLTRFKDPSKFGELCDFRTDWTNLHKTDQDNVLYSNMKECLEEPMDDAVPAKWMFLGAHVCLKAWKRLHAVGPWPLYS